MTTTATPTLLDSAAGQRLAWPLGDEPDADQRRHQTQARCATPDGNLPVIAGDGNVPRSETVPF
jgi:hypothetical protein